MYADEIDRVLYGETFSKDQRQNLAKQGKAKSDGSYPIRNKSDLKNAIQAFGRAKDKASVKRWIIRRARALGQLKMLPDGWNVSAEDLNQTLNVPLHLESDGVPGLAVVAEGATPEDAPWRARGAERFRVPFYVGDSVANIPGFTKKFYFPTSLIDGIVSEANRQITEGRQALNIYKRHNVADGGYDLPVGAIIKAEREGRIGYVTLEVEPTDSGGKDIITLARGKKLNAVSLRSAPGRFEAELRTVNAEDMYVPTMLKLDGVDFAPDNPAMPTYGLEMLAAEANVGDVIKKKEETVPEEISLTSLKAEHPSVVAEIEAPFRTKVADLTTALEAEKGKVTAIENKNGELAEKVKTLEAEKAKRELDSFVASISTRFPEPEKALPILLELSKECKTTDEISSKLMPLLLERTFGDPGKPADPKPSLNDQLAGLFKVGGAGAIDDPKKPDEKTGVNAEVVRMGGVALEIPE